MLGASTRKVGRQVACPTCSATVTVPSAEEAAAAATMRRFEHPQIEETLNKLADLDRSVASPADSGRSVAANRRLEGAERTMLLLPRVAVYFQAGLLAAVALVFFLAGWWIGGAGTRPSAQPVGATAGAPSLEVLLQYRHASGELRADDGAAVLVLPIDKHVTDKMPAAPLDPSSPAPNAADPAISKLSLLGGAYGRTNAAGKLPSLVVPRAGKHYVLLLSNHATRVGEPRPQDLAVLGSYLEGAAELIGQRQYRLTTEELSDAVVIAYEFGG